MTNLSDISKKFKNSELFELALTHRSWVNENAGTSGHNERLEFLGDAVLEFVVSSFLYKNFPDKEEGFLTALRSNIVNTRNLATLAEELKLGEALKLSKGEEQGNGRANESLLANTVEALIGAIYVDRGLVDAKAFIHESLLYDMDTKLKEPLKDAKSRLQEIIQAEGLPAPKYSVMRESGPDHDKEFEVHVTIDNARTASGTGKSKSRAEQAAAAAALVKHKLEK